MSSSEIRRGRRRQESAGSSNLIPDEPVYNSPKTIKQMSLEEQQEIQKKRQLKSTPIKDKVSGGDCSPNDSASDISSLTIRASPKHHIHQYSPGKSPAHYEAERNTREKRLSSGDTLHAEGESLSLHSLPTRSSQKQQAHQEKLATYTDSPFKDGTQGSTSSRRPSGGNTSLEGSRSITSQSDNRSFRERIRDRVQSVREQASSAVIEAKSRSRLRDRKQSQSFVSRFEDLVHKEEAVVGAALKRHSHSRVQRDNATQNGFQPPSEEACLDFFTQVWESSEMEIAESQTDVPTLPPVAEIEESEESEENTKLLTTDFLNLPGEWDLVETVGATYLDPKIFIAQEESLYFFATCRPVPVELKIPLGSHPRYPEIEGLFVGEPLEVPLKRVHRLEQRMILSGSRQWFGEDGDVISLPDPRRDTPCRPFSSFQYDPALEIEYKYAEISDVSKKIMNPCLGQTYYQLELYIKSITFSHHPLFSLEHVMAQQLTELYDKYYMRKQRKYLEWLAGRLDAVREARDRLKQLMGEETQPRGQQKERLQKYICDIRDLRNLVFTEGRKDRELLMKIIDVWNSIRKLRAQQGFSSTPWHLRIFIRHRKQADAELKAYEKILKIEWEEVVEDKQQEYYKDMIAYHKALNDWTKKQKSLQEQQKTEESIERMEESRDRNVGSVLDNQHDKKPQPPGEIDWDVEWDKMLKRISESFRLPSEPQTRLVLIQSNKVTQAPENQKEHRRRLAVKRSRLYLRVFYNDEEVCSLLSRPLQDQFNIPVDELVTLCIINHPKSLTVKIYEESSFLDHMLAEVYIPIPGRSTTLHSAQEIHHEFSNDSIITFTHSGVGSGLNSIKSSDSSAPRCLFTTGHLICKTGWSVSKEDHKILAPPLKYWQYVDRNHTEELLEHVLDACDKGDHIEKLYEWAESSQMDPNDPSHGAFFSMLQNSNTLVGPEPTYFRLDPLDEVFNFCSSHDLKNNLRLCLLILRDRNEPEFRGIQFVPIREKEIRKEVFKAYEERLAAPVLHLDTSSSADPLESHRLWGKHFLQEVRQRVMKMCRQAQQHRQLKDIVTEDQVPDIGSLGITFKKWLEPRRPLKPIRKERKRVPIQNLGGQEVKVVVNVVRAFAVPIRKDPDTVLHRTSITHHMSLIQGHKFALVPVRPFVEVSFQGTTLRTTTADGANPTWNQYLQLPFHPPSGDFSPRNMLDIEDELHLNIFDETVVDLLEDDRARETSIHQRFERHWLGSLRIPFSTLYHNVKIEGTFKLYSPPVILGYERELPQQKTGILSAHGDFQLFPPPQDATFLTLFITVQPPLSPPEPFKEQLESGEPAYMQEHLKEWEERVTGLFPKRQPKTLVIDISGKSVCVTRFFRPLAPPELEKDIDTTPDMAARFVSMIPMVSGSVLFPGLFDIWLTSDQVLRLLSGDAEDHAVLLCCYLLYLKRPAWLLLGTGIPHGPTAYVLERHEDGTFWLWEPASAQCFSVQDSFCPLKKVYCLINDENIWANVQSTEMPNQTRYDVNDRSDWLPAFGRIISPPTSSIQPPLLEYSPTSSSAVQLLQDKIEKHLKDSLMKWRSTAKTLWNRYCIAILRKILPVLERETWCLEEAGSIDHLLELRHILGSHKMCGFPINLPYTNLSAITESVQATGVHYSEGSEVEFALAVYIHPYPNNVLSVWVYVASLTRRR